MTGQHYCYQGKESHAEVIELRDAAYCLAHCLEQYIDDEMSMDKSELARLWVALAAFGYERGSE